MSAIVLDRPETGALTLEDARRVLGQVWGHGDFRGMQAGVVAEVLAGRETANYDYNVRRLELERELALLKYANERQISLDDAKVALARDTMKLQLQRELAGADGEGPQVATPPTEPAGRAAPGRAYQE